MADRTSLTEFRDNYEAKNGQIGSQDVLNKAVDKVKQELDALWSWTADSTDTLPAGTIADAIIDDSIAYTNLPSAQSLTRSANYIGLRISNDPANNGSIIDTWSTAQITSQLSNKASINSPTFTGNPSAPTPSSSDNDTSIATTAFVQTVVNNVLSTKANINSPTFTGTPAAPTPSTSNNDTSIATTAFVRSAISTYAAAPSAAAADGLGYNQTWQSVTRTSGVTYTNTTTRPIALSIKADLPNMTGLEIRVSGGQQVKYYNQNANQISVTAFMIIPVGVTYLAYLPSIAYCFELR